MPVALSVGQLAGVFTDDELPPHSRRVRVQHKPQRKNAKRQHGAQAHLERELQHDTPFQRRSAEQLGAPQRGRSGGNQGEGFVGQSQTQCEPEGDMARPANACRNRGAVCIGAFTLAQQPEHRQAEPECFRGAGQVSPTKSIGAKECQVQTRGDAGAARRACHAPRGPGHGTCDQQRVEQAGQAQRGHVPVLAPVTRHHRLPEQQGRLGVAHVVEFRDQWQPVVGGGGQARDMGVDELVAVARVVLTAQAQRIDQNGHGQQGDPGQGRGVRHALGP